VDSGWRRAALFRYRAELEAADPIGRTAPRAILGIAETILPPGEPWRIDRRSTVELLLDNSADALVDMGIDQLLQGANLCQVGDEILQFGRADPIGPRRYRLSCFIRGWHGTEWACPGHAVGERFVLLDAARLAPVEAGLSDVGQVMALRAVGRGDPVPAEAERLIDGRAMLPPSPVHARFAATDAGDLEIRWIRRSRLGWAWPDSIDAPLGEELERYRLSVIGGGVALREWETSGPMATYAAADIVADLVAAAPALPRLEIRQRGIWGMSRPLLIDLP
jgi:hypothetical protein